jgi:GTPase SAR1 family protein
MSQDTRPSVSSGLLAFRDVLYGAFLDFANRESALAEEAKALLLMQEIERNLETVVAYPEIFMKNIVAIGGGFSSGKSALASSFFNHDKIKLPIGIEPVTAIPTYIISSDSDSITGFSSNGGTIQINTDTYGKLSHDYVKSFGFNLRDIMPYMAIGTPMDQAVFQHMCLIDTPGYNPAASDGYTAEDKITALEHLQNANALIWVIGLDSTGTIPKSDLDFLESLDLSDKHLFVVANKSDLKDQGELEDILDCMEKVLDENEIPYSGLSAYSANHRKEYYAKKKSFVEFLTEQNKCVPLRDILVEKLNVVFDMYIHAINKSRERKKSIENELKSLRLDLLEIGLDEGSLDQAKTQFCDRIEKISSMSGDEHLSTYLTDIEQLKGSMVRAVDDVFAEISTPRWSENGHVPVTEIRFKVRRDNDGRVLVEGGGQLSRSAEASRLKIELVTGCKDKLCKFEEENPYFAEQMKDMKSQLTLYKKWSTCLLKRLLESSPVDGDFLLSASIPVAVLGKLAAAEQWHVREAVAKKKNTPISALRILLNDSDSDVATAADETLRSLGYDIRSK